MALRACASPDHPAGRVYTLVRYVFDARYRVSENIADCACCAFWRGALLAGALVELANLLYILIRP